MGVPKRDRLKEFFRRLAAAPRARTFDEALTQVANIMTAVEDEMTDVPNVPANWRQDGRIYPPQSDSQRAVPDHPLVRRFRSFAHSTFIGANGSIEIVAVSGAVEFSKDGADGRGVWDLN